MASKIYISGFPPSYTQRQLRQIFVPFGKVKSVQVLRDTRGNFLGMVQMSSPEEVEHIATSATSRRTARSQAI